MRLHKLNEIPLAVNCAVWVAPNEKLKSLSSIVASVVFIATSVRKEITWCATMGCCAMNP